MVASPGPITLVCLFVLLPLGYVRASWSQLPEGGAEYEKQRTPEEIRAQDAENARRDTEGFARDAAAAAVGKEEPEAKFNVDAEIARRDTEGFAQDSAAAAVGKEELETKFNVDAENCRRDTEGDQAQFDVDKNPEWQQELVMKVIGLLLQVGVLFWPISVMLSLLGSVLFGCSMCAVNATEKQRLETEASQSRERITQLLADLAAEKAKSVEMVASHTAEKQSLAAEIAQSGERVASAETAVAAEKAKSLELVAAEKSKSDELSPLKWLAAEKSQMTATVAAERVAAEKSCAEKVLMTAMVGGERNTQLRADLQAAAAAETLLRAESRGNEVERLQAEHAVEVQTLTDEATQAREEVSELQAKLETQRVAAEAETAVALKIKDDDLERLRAAHGEELKIAKARSMTETQPTEVDEADDDEFGLGATQLESAAKKKVVKTRSMTETQPNEANEADDDEFGLGATQLESAAKKSSATTPDLDRLLSG